MQIEHHLFPSLHYSFYYEIAPIVKKCCKDYGVPYNESKTLWEALGKHYQLLSLLSKA